MSEIKCACGCGGTPKPGNRYINHHNRRKRVKSELVYCACGCGEILNKYRRSKKDSVAKDGFNHSAIYERKYIMGHDKRKYYDDWDEIIECACGCGDTLMKYSLADKKHSNHNRPRRFIQGHHNLMPNKIETTMRNFAKYTRGNPWMFRKIDGEGLKEVFNIC